ncbi:MAG: CPBP family intramembrane glutamic endopeptidase [Rhodospirillales bacterium]
MADSQKTGSNLKHDALLLALLYAPVFLNDFGFMASETEGQFLAVDYVSKVLVILIVLSIPRFRGYIRPYLGWPGRPYEDASMTWLRVVMLSWLAVLFMMGIAYYWEWPMERHMADISVYRFPKIDTAWLNWTDLTFGLALNAIAEEFASRGVLKGVFERYVKSAFIIILVSSVVFALTHWGKGLPNITGAFLCGIVLMGLFLYTRSLWPPMIAHYFINLWHFS